MGPRLAAAPHYTAETVSALKNHGAIDTRSKAMAETRCTDRLRALLHCLWSALESVFCSWVLVDKVGQNLGLLQRSSHRCVFMSAAPNYGKRQEALVSFSPEDFDSNVTGLENLSVQVLLSMHSTVWTVLLSHLSISQHFEESRR